MSRKKTKTKRTDAHQAEVKSRGKTSPFADAFKRWQAGEQLSVLAEEFTSGKRSKLRKELIKLAGGKAQFRALREQGAGGSTEPFGGKRAEGGARPEIDDSKVNRVKHCRKSNGWTWRGFGDDMVHIAPDGTEYIRARATEAADLIVTHEDETMQITPSRMKLFAGSREAKKAKREEKLIDRGQEAHEAKRAAKRAAKPKRIKRKQ